jgi:glycosyltransferase involved in cell wall biosynthesis
MDYLFLCFNHRLRDPRLYHRQAEVISQVFPELKVGFAKDGKILDRAMIELGKKSRALGLSSNRPGSQNFMYRLLRFLLMRIWGFISAIQIFWKVGRARPTVIQASDARELFFAWACKVFYGINYIYDAHEDYPRQILDYSSNSFLGKILALAINFQEKVLVKYASHTFCTDDHLLEKYQGFNGVGEKVTILRNFPMANDKLTKDEFNDITKLKLIYIGSVNKFRGIIETSEYCSIFNSKHAENNTSVSFDVYSPANGIVYELELKNMLKHHGWRDYSELKDDLREYHVGICLWQDIPKFRLNLPLKNFDYMSVGLPIITSNFGNLKRYAEESGAAICIAPDSYSEFECAVLELMSGSTREKLSKNGRRYVSEKASFENEAGYYLEKIRNLTSPENVHLSK